MFFVKQTLVLSRSIYRTYRCLCALFISILFLITSTSVSLSANDVSSGNSVDLDAYRPLYSSVAADGVSLNEIVGIGIAGSDDHVYIWYMDGTVSSGSTRDLDQYRERRSYLLPPGYWPEDIVGMGIAGSNDWIYTWFRDGKVAAGTSTNLTQYRPPYDYELPPGKGPLSIVGMGIAGSDDHVWVWYDDGEVSSGTTRDLDAYRVPQAYSAAQGYNHDQIIGMGIAGSNDHIYTWYGTCAPPSSQMLNLRNTPQETNKWCWAASAWMVMNYVGNVQIPQCTQANNRFSMTNCCNAPTPATCVAGGWPEFWRYGFTNSVKSGPLSWDELRKEIAHGGSCRGRPFAFSWAWYAQRPDGTWHLDGGHMMVAMGYYTVDGDRYVEVQDPWPPNGGEYRVDAYEIFVREDFNHEHWDDYHDVKFTGGL